MRFMVVIHMKGEFDEEFMALVPADTAYSDQLRERGIQGEIMMSEDYRQCWSIFNAGSREELQAVLEGFPLYSKLRYEVHALVKEE